MSVIFLISGTPGAGKTSVAAALLRRFPFGLHVPVDDLREWVVSGFSPPIPVWTEETTRQFTLARTAAAMTARLYADAGFAVVLDDVLFHDAAQSLLDGPLSGVAVQKILLAPRLEIALARNATRTNKIFNTSFLAGVIITLHAQLARENTPERGWKVLDSSDWTADETAANIFNPL